MKEKKLTGYSSIDNPQNIGTTFFERNTIIPNTNIYNTFKLLSMFYLNNSAIDCIDLNVTYGQLLDDVLTISLALKELGVKAGDIISVIMPNYYQALSVFFACNRIGAITTFLDFYASQEEIINYLNLFESPIVIDYDKSDDYNKVLKDKTNLKYIITLNKQDTNSRDLDKNYKITYNDFILNYNTLGSIATYQKSKFERLHTKKEDALILFTSGSTGKPKSVVLTNENVLAAEIYAKNTSHTKNIKATKTLTCVPFSYPYGFVTSALTSLLWGKETILAPDISKDTINYYYSKRPNIIFGSPALLDLTIANVDINQDLSFVSHFVSGGDFLTLEHAKRGNVFFANHGASNVEIGNGFGNAETVSIGSTPVGVPLRQETAGKILVGTTAMIVNPDTMEEKKYGEIGMLCISGKHIFREYYKNAELTSETKIIKNGKEYYKTGTMGFIDQQGYFTVTGRQSRFYIVSSLNKVYCDKIQNIISTYPMVKDCAIVKVPDDEQLYVNKAYIVLNDGYMPTKEIYDEIINLFYLPSKDITGKNIQLKSYEIPSYIEIIDELPRLKGSDKIDYLTLEVHALNNIQKSKKLSLKK